MSIRVSYDEVEATIRRALLRAGLSDEVASECARTHASTSLDGIESHGLNRVPRFIDYVRKGWVDPSATPELVGAHGAVENYDGHLGPGITNARFAMGRAIALAREHGIGCIALRNTTHWMRGGTYAWQAAEAGMMALCWTNTESSMPLWGSAEPSVGNNPICIAVPRSEGPVVLDMALSQYSWGKIGSCRLQGVQLPYPGGFDAQGNLTSDPVTIEETRRILPTGYWKGSGMALALDLVAAALANGKSGSQMDDEGRGSCTGACQVFVALDPYLFGSEEEVQGMVNERIARADAATPLDPDYPVTYPGERTLQTRERNLREGVVVDEMIWQQVCGLAEGTEGSIEDLSAV
ncbi:3-dehydro-L-gulonate 2-dehydrogenase [Olsenella profusa]|nr:3-dehydro-L-gulonate 2-dehydrogenase [Olsenella profusa]